MTESVSKKTTFRLTERQESFLFSALLVIVCLVYSSLYFSNTYPITEGWNVFNAELILRGQVPYRDFYYYLPPLNLLIDAILWKLSFGSLLAYRAWYLLQRIVILLLLFHIMRKEFSAPKAFLAVAVTSVVLTGSAYDLLGDYNQMTILLSEMFLLFALRFAKAGEAVRRRRELFFAGFILGLMFLNKQTIFVATLLCYILVLGLYCIRAGDRQFPVYCGCTALGAILPVGAACVWLFLNGALLPFIEQVFLNSDGKGSLFSILFTFALKWLIKAVALGAVCFAAALLVLYWDSPAVEEGRKRFRNVIGRVRSMSRLLRTAIYTTAGASFLIVLFLLGFQVFNWYVLNWSVLFAMDQTIAWVLLLSAVLLAGLFFACVRNDGAGEARALLLSFLCVLLVGSCFALSTDLSRALYTETIICDWIHSELPSFFSVLCVLAAVVFFLRKEYPRLFLCCGAFSMWYSCAMNAGNTAPLMYAVAISMPVVLCMAFSLPIPYKKIKAGLWVVLCFWCMVSVSVCVAQKRVSSYVWWGASVGAYEERGTKVESIPALAGITGPEDEAEALEEISCLISENTEQDDTVWGYPYIKLFNILTDRYKMNGFVPVLFYDVVSDRYVEKEMEMISTDLPELVLWMDIPYCKENHEKTFRDGEPLKQRDLEALFSDWIPQEYQVLGYYDGIEVYRLREEGLTCTEGNAEDILTVECSDADLHRTDDGTWVEDYRFSVESPLSFRIPTELAFRVEPGCSVTGCTASLDGRFLSLPLPVDWESGPSGLAVSYEVPQGESIITITVEGKRDAEDQQFRKAAVIYDRYRYLEPSESAD